MSETWIGQDAGVRRPMTGETPLSPAEVAVGLRDGVFRPLPDAWQDEASEAQAEATA
jgi:hypothetical protein